MEEILEFSTECLSLEKYHFKILTMITVLADSKAAFRGKISDLCHSLSIQTSSGNITKIKSSLDFLTKSNYINILVDKDIYTVTLTKAAESNKNIIKIKNAWYKLIKETPSEAAWENMLKVFLVLIELPSCEDKPITYKEIGDIIKCSKSTVQRAVKTICNIDFKDFKFIKDVKKERLNDGSYRTTGTIYTQGIFFE